MVPMPSNATINLPASYVLDLLNNTDPNPDYPACVASRNELEWDLFWAQICLFIFGAINFFLFTRTIVLLDQRVHLTRENARLRKEEDQRKQVVKEKINPWGTIYRA